MQTSKNIKNTLYIEKSVNRKFMVANIFYKKFSTDAKENMNEKWQK